MNNSGVISHLKEAEFRLDRVCRQFEQAWRLNRPITIEQCLNDVDPIERSHLLEELIASEWELRVRRGEDPEAAEYLARFPQEEELVAAICGVLAVEYAEASSRNLSTTPQPGDHLGDYKIIREVGRGGMGIVYEARQESLGRQVALKVLPARRFRGERELHRFRREAQAVARLHHSHIVEIYGVGEQEGIHYFAMRYVTGRGIDQVIAELRDRLGLSEDDAETSVLHEPKVGGRGSLSAIHSSSSLLLSRAFTSFPDSIDSMSPGARYRAAARIGLQAAEALQYAHERGIQHRDVKPSNLLIDRHEVVWLTDFGLAKLDLDATNLTASDDLIGTLRYMPPEALTGKIDHRSDIYSLGLTLYELVTLRPALDGSDRAQLLEQVRDPQISTPRWLTPDLPRDLETIILKSMARDLDQRYQSAKELAEDLERFLNHEPIRARPQSLFTKFRRWIERKPLMAFLALGTLSITSTSIFSFGALYYNALATARQARKDRDFATELLHFAQQANRSSELSRHAAEISTLQAQSRLVQAQRSEAAAYLQQGDDFAALVWTAEALRSAERLKQLQDSQREGDHDSQGNLVSVSGQLSLEPALRLRVGAIIQNSPRIVLREWLPVTAPGLAFDTSANAEGARNATAMWFSNDGRHLCLSNRERTRVHRWDLETGRQDQQSVPGPTGTCVFTHYGTARVFHGGYQSLQYAATSADASQPLIDLQVPIIPETSRLHAAWDSSDGQHLLASFADDRAESSWIWNLSTGRLESSQPLPIQGTVEQAEFSRDGRRLLVRTRQQVQVFDLLHMKPLVDRQYEPAGSAWSRDGRWFTGRINGHVQVERLDAPTEAPQILEMPTVKQLDWHADGRSLAALLPRGRVAFFQSNVEGRVSFQDSVQPSEIVAQGFGFSPDGQWYALGHEDGHVRIWNTRTHQPWSTLLRHPGAVRSLCWGPGGDLLATCTPTGLLTVWGLKPSATGKVYFHTEQATLTGIRFTGDGQQVIATDKQGATSAWNLKSGSSESVVGAQPDKPIGLRPGGAEPWRIERRPHSAEYAAIGADRHVYHFKSIDEKSVRRVPLPSGFRAVEFTFNSLGTKLAVVGNLGLAILDADTDRLIWKSPTAEATPLTRVAFSSDGTQLATVSDDHFCQIRLGNNWIWQGMGFQLDSRPVLAEFNTRDNTFITATESGLVQVWDWSRGEPLIPPLRAGVPLVAADLSSNSRQVVVAGQHHIHVWELPEPNLLPSDQIAAWAREVALTDVNIIDGTLTPLISGQYPGRSAEADQQRKARSPLDPEWCRLWHLYQANSAHLMQDSQAEEFHRQRLRELD